MPLTPSVRMIWTCGPSGLLASGRWPSVGCSENELVECPSMGRKFWISTFKFVTFFLFFTNVSSLKSTRLFSKKYCKRRRRSFFEKLKKQLMCYQCYLPTFFPYFRLTFIRKKLFAYFLTIRWFCFIEWTILRRSLFLLLLVHDHWRRTGFI